LARTYSARIPSQKFVSPLSVVARNDSLSNLRNHGNSAAIFFTDYSIAPIELAPALEERGFDSLWVAERSRIPVTRRFSLPGGMELSKQYYDVMDPFVTLSAAADYCRRRRMPARAARRSSCRNCAEWPRKPAAICNPCR
jgi:hypothetical protein